MKIAVLGSGAMGGLFGAYLSRENDVTMVDINPAVVERINTQGLEVREPDGSSAVYRPRAVQNARGMDPVDLVIIFMNARFSEAALGGNPELIGPETYLMTLQNGSGHEDTLAKFAAKDRIIIGTTQHNANAAEPGVSNHGGSGVTHLGCVTGSAARLQPIADTFTAEMTYKVNGQTYTDTLEDYSVQQYCEDTLDLSDADLQKYFGAAIAQITAASSQG